MAMTERDWEKLLFPRSVTDIIESRYRKEDQMTKMTDVISGELEAELLLGEDAVRLARGSFEALGVQSLSAYVAVAYPGGLDELREERRQRETVRLARRRDSGRRQTALELADQLGVPRDAVEAEFEREGL